MPHQELLDWVVYAERNGPLNLMLRFDAAVARLAAMWSKDARPSDFMPWPAKPDVEATPQDVFALLQGIAQANKKSTA